MWVPIIFCLAKLIPSIKNLSKNIPELLSLPLRFIGFAPTRFTVANIPSHMMMRWLSVQFLTASHSKIWSWGVKKVEEGNSDFFLLLYTSKPAEEKKALLFYLPKRRLSRPQLLEIPLLSCLRWNIPLNRQTKASSPFGKSLLPGSNKSLMP